MKKDIKTLSTKDHPAWWRPGTKWHRPQGCWLSLCSDTLTKPGWLEQPILSMHYWYEMGLMSQKKVELSWTVRDSVHVSAPGCLQNNTTRSLVMMEVVLYYSGSYWLSDFQSCHHLHRLQQNIWNSREANQLQFRNGDGQSSLVSERCLDSGSDSLIELLLLDFIAHELQHN